MRWGETSSFFNTFLIWYQSYGADLFFFFTYYTNTVDARMTLTPSVTSVLNHFLFQPEILPFILSLERRTLFLDRFYFMLRDHQSQWIHTTQVTFVTFAPIPLIGVVYSVTISTVALQHRQTITSGWQNTSLKCNNTPMSPQKPDFVILENAARFIWCW